MNFCYHRGIRINKVFFKYTTVVRVILNEWALQIYDFVLKFKKRYKTVTNLMK